MTTEELKKRTLLFGVSVARFCKTIHPNPLLKPYANQLIRASSSVGANYRAACRAKSGKDFINKLKIVEEECDECMFFFELIKELNADSQSTTRKSLNQSKKS